MLPDLVVLDLQCGGGLARVGLSAPPPGGPGGAGGAGDRFNPGISIGMERHAAEVRSLDVAIFDGFAQYDDMLAAARAATA